MVCDPSKAKGKSLSISGETQPLEGFRDLFKGCSLLETVHIPKGKNEKFNFFCMETLDLMVITQQKNPAICSI